MTNPRIQEIENQILELTRKDHHSGIYGDWARLIRRFLVDSNEQAWNYADFEVNEDMSPLEVIKKIISFGANQPAYLTIEIQNRLTELTDEWEILLERERERATGGKQ